MNTPVSLAMLKGNLTMHFRNKPNMVDKQTAYG